MLLPIHWLQNVILGQIIQNEILLVLYKVKMINCQKPTCNKIKLIVSQPTGKVDDYQSFIMTFITFRRATGT